MKVQAGGPDVPSALTPPAAADAPAAMGPRREPDERPSFLSSASLGGQGVYVGEEAAGGSFAYDPWLLVERDLLRNGNVLVTGNAGQGKTALVITYLWRQQVFGRSAWVADTTGAYRGLAEHSGREVIRLEPGSALRLNPLDRPATMHRDPDPEGGDERSRALADLMVMVLHRSLTAQEVTACRIAVAAAARRHDDLVTLPGVAEALLQPDAAAVHQMGPLAQSISMSARHLGLALRVALRDHLGGLFDEPTTVGMAQPPATVIDLSAVAASAARDLVLLAAARWLQAAAAAEDAPVLVLDDASPLLAAGGGGLRATGLLAGGGASTMLVGRLPALSDRAAAASGRPPSPTGGAPSPDDRGGDARAGNLTAVFPTRVIHHLPAAAVPQVAGLLGVTSDEAAVLPTLPPGQALWKVGTRSFLVTHRIGGQEWPLLDGPA